ncbi:hypothetical protein Enr17x_38050 [Gimesia fumaroli]|uniref:Sulfatase n=1 Tax=Gimesia fumaroli TaxID=2527976 RepID=A0A518IF89_9PLAN|nr:hypothetical protein Enr17x_38050 [Gimesia fumaroli]
MLKKCHLSHARNHRKTDPLRRRLLQSVSAGMMGVGLAEMLSLEAVAKSESMTPGQAKRVLVVYEEGGISQMDTWDPKPEAPYDHRTPFKSIATNVPGINFSSLMPMTAQQADKLSVIRSMTSARVAGHKEGCQEFFKGYRFDSSFDFPDIGSVVTDQMGTDCRQLPGYIFCPGINMPNHVTSTGFLPASRAPWKLGTKNLGENLADPTWKVKSLQLNPKLSTQRFNQRRELLSQLDRSAVAKTESAETLQAYYENAVDLLTSPRIQASLNLSTESDKTRDRYGRDHRGCCYLLGRKLIEAGVRFVSVTVVQPPEHVNRPGYGQPKGVFLNWDHHEGIYQNGPCGGPQGNSNQERFGLPHPVMMPSLDRSFSALIEDMHARGLLEDTLVCFITEMGRTPRVNKWGGRDHWGRAMSVALAGAGVPGGQLIGATNKEGGDVTDRLYTPYDYAETIYRKLGIDTAARIRRPDGLPIEFTDGGHPIAEVF